MLVRGRALRLELRGGGRALLHGDKQRTLPRRARHLPLLCLVKRGERPLDHTKHMRRAWRRAPPLEYRRCGPCRERLLLRGHALLLLRGDDLPGLGCLQFGYLGSGERFGCLVATAVRVPQPRPHGHLGLELAQSRLLIAHILPQQRPQPEHVRHQVRRLGRLGRRLGACLTLGGARYEGRGRTPLGHLLLGGAAAASGLSGSGRVRTLLDEHHELRGQLPLLQHGGVGRLLRAREPVGCAHLGSFTFERAILIRDAHVRVHVTQHALDDAMADHDCL